MRSIAKLVVLCTALLLPTGAWAQGRGNAAVSKPSVAIKEIKDLANTGQAEVLGAMIQTALVGTGKFRVIERDFTQLDSEQNLGKRKVVTTNRPGRSGGYEGVDFLVYGTITGGGSSKQGDTGASLGRAAAEHMLGFSLGGNGCSRTVASIAVDIKIVDSDSGEVRFTKRINRTQKTKTSCSGDMGVDLAGLLRLAADDTATGLVTTLYPIQVAAVQADGTLVLNYGEGTIEPNAMMVVFIKGADIMDPVTGERLANEEQRIGLVTVTDVGPRVSKAIAAGPFSSPPMVGAIVRMATPADMPATGKKKKK